MLSGKLVEVIEQHWETIASRVIGSIKRHPDMEVLGQRPEIELREWVQQIVENLGYVLSGDTRSEVKRRYEVVGRIRYEESIPLHEAVLRFHILKDKVIGFVHEQGFAVTAIQLYAEEELERRLCNTVDVMVYHVVRGYEQAMRQAARLAS